ncbi:MAG: hypothetical protein K2O45_17315 [Oscillospiraceae bacterium]|nr:hypothetical protein [Oscillospiraceae bacterium]
MRGSLYKEDLKDLRVFDQLGYRFHGELSAENHHHYVFLKQPRHSV